ncbi:metal ABC transporter permease [Corynebacterium sanguinis]|uniref:metal ABC transporter permease n=1 Tax=Corynebacterium sanguinis TaxID=2594913 RepID=UPI00223C3F78|nr:metal ABC transporter permease [Corynebacterium sanguinis]MCT2287680.1 metal ABC transporter permease [Corynebacterium sanguinis]
MALIDALSTPLQYSFIQNALLIASAVAIAAGLLSCWLVLIGWSLLGDAISHAVLPGVVLAYVAGVPFAVGALVAALVTVTVLQVVSSRSTLKEDASIGIVFTTLFAVGLVLITLVPGAGHVQEILFGNVLGMTTSAMIQVAVCVGAGLAIIAAGGRAFTLWAFDPIHARTLGFPLLIVRMALLVALALITVAGVQAVGVILVVALLITPGATAYLLTNRFRRMLVIAPLVAWVSAVAGIMLSFYLDVSAAGTIVSVMSAQFAAAFLFGKREGLLRRRAT